MKDYDNIRDFGAVGDGVHDDTQALTDAMAAAAGQGIVFLPAGVYAIRPVQVPAHIILMGRSGWGAPGAEGPCAVLRALPGEGGALLNLREAHGTRVTGLVLDGGCGGSELDGIAIQGGQQLCCAVEDCAIRGFSGCGVTVAQADAFALRRCRIASVGAHGMTLKGSSHGVIIDCVVEDAAAAGIHAGENAASATLVANRVTGCREGGVVLEDTAMAQVNGCILTGCGPRGIRLSRCTGVSVTGCIVSGSGEALSVDAGSDITAAGNVFSAAEDVPAVQLTGTDNAVAAANAPGTACPAILTRENALPL